MSERTDSIRTANECAYGPNTVGRLCALALCYPHGPAQHSGADEELPEEPLCGQDYTRVSRMLGNEHYRVPAPFDVYVRADRLQPCGSSPLAAAARTALRSHSRNPRVMAFA